MLAGIGPILGEGLVGSFVDPDNVISNWFYEEGASKINSTTIIKVSGSAYNLLQPLPKVSVLRRSNQLAKALNASKRGNI